VRLLAFSSEKLGSDLKAIVLYRLKYAIEKRKKIDLPNNDTNIFRLVNSEADRLSGLTIDVAADTLILSVTAYWVMFYRDIIQACLKELGFKNTIWRKQFNALAQDGWKEEVKEADTEQLITVKENGLLYQIDVGLGQKTGFYCDQRDNRFLVRKYAKEKTVLDCFCYSGGFALSAAIAGAKKVVGIDSSAAAIKLANANIALNKMRNVEFVEAKVEEYLAAAPGFDFIIMDPPKLAPTINSLPRAKQKYLKLNAMAMSVLPANGLLLTCSCSNALSEEDFTYVLKLAAKKAGREISILKKMHASADHPFLEKSKYGNYLKVVLLQMV